MRGMQVPTSREGQGSVGFDAGCYVVFLVGSKEEVYSKR